MSKPKPYDDDDFFPGFPIGETKEDFEAKVDALMDWAERHRPPPPPPTFAYGNAIPKVWGREVMPNGHVRACPRTPVSRLIHRLPTRFIEALEQNQQIASCCRHPENHDIEAFFSCKAEEERGTPDVYVNICSCGRRHTRFMCGGGTRPVWR